MKKLVNAQSSFRNCTRLSETAAECEIRTTAISESGREILTQPLCQTETIDRHWSVTGPIGKGLVLGIFPRRPAGSPD